MWIVGKFLKTIIVAGKKTSQGENCLLFSKYLADIFEYEGELAPGHGLDE